MQPDANLSGPIPADELRAQFELKLWNSYAFLCNYARLDGFDPTAPAVPFAQRPDLDRWILSDLQHLVSKARESFENYELMAFPPRKPSVSSTTSSATGTFAAPQAVHAEEQAHQKQAAYQTLYTVLVTLTKLFAAIMPFLAETMYRPARPAPTSRSSRSPVPLSAAESTGRRGRAEDMNRSAGSGVARLRGAE